MRLQNRCTHCPLPSCMLPHLSPSHTAMVTTGEPANGANVASGVNVNGAGRNGVSTSGASVKIGAGIETTPDGATSEKSDLRVLSNESHRKSQRCVASLHALQCGSLKACPFLEHHLVVRRCFHRSSFGVGRERRIQPRQARPSSGRRSCRSCYGTHLR